MRENQLRNNALRRRSRNERVATDLSAIANAGGSPRTRRGWGRTEVWDGEALERFGENGMARGLSLRETLWEYSICDDHASTVNSGQRIERCALIAHAWMDASRSTTALDACVDASTGLTRPGYLRARLNEIVRQCRADATSPSDTYEFLVVAPPIAARHDASQDLGVVARAVQPHLEWGTTAARWGPSTIVILRNQDHNSAELLRATRAALATVGCTDWRVWTERVSENAAFMSAQLFEITVASQHHDRTEFPTEVTQRVFHYSKRNAILANHQDDANHYDNILSAARVGEPTYDHLRHYAADSYEGAMTFDDVINQLRSIRSMLPLDVCERFDHGASVLALCEPWEVEPLRVELANAFDTGTGTTTPHYLDQRLAEIGPRPVARCEIKLRPLTSFDDYGLYLRFAATVVRIFDSAETTTATGRDHLTVLSNRSIAFASQRRKLAEVIRTGWANELVIDVRDSYA